MASGSDTGRFSVRRLRSALSLWRASIRGTDLLVAGFFVASSLGLGAYLLARAQAPAHLAFAERAQRFQAEITERLSMPKEDLATLQSFFETSGRVTRRQFHSMTDSMLARHRIVYALEWLPLVRGNERFFYEAEARAAGLTDYRFWEAGPDGKPREAAERPYYVPIHYMEPPNALALGFDIAAEPGRWRNAEAARDSGLIVASRPFVLIEDLGKPDASPSIALYAPVYLEGDPGSEPARRASISGFVMAIFRVAPLVQVAAAAADASGLGFALSDVESRGAPPMVERPGRVAASPRRAGFELDFPVECADRVWTLNVFALPDAFLPSKRAAVAAALAGAVAALLGLVMVTSLRTISRLRRQAEKVGPYRLVARLGHGAMGVVWEARHALLRRPTAIKLLAPGTEGERALARFEREVQLTAGLTHPSTIAIYDYGRTADGVFYYAMELLRGINLQQLVSVDGPLPPARVVHLLRQACGALAEAHAAGLIHRDIKPANLMICVYGGIPDFLKVLDFGLVKDIGAVERAPDGEAAAEHGDATLSQDGSLLGTPLYMAPEGMSDPSRVDVRADLFALGAVGYFLLTGRSPFPGRTAIEVFSKERQGPPSSLSSASAHPVPAALDEVVRRCLAFDREERPASVEKLDAMLEPCAAAAPWRPEDARAWWRDRGPTGLAAARAEREEAGQVLFLSSDSRFRS
ncbi:MAG: CHASE domain-containing protein [Thermoanaerobaculia bacterium]